MKVLLVSTTFNSLTYYDFGYNYGVAYISGVLKKNNIDNSYLIIKNNKDKYHFLNTLKRKSPDIIAFSVTTNQIIFIKELLKEVRKVSNSLLVAGGVHFSLMPETIDNIPELDVIIRGEGEYPLLELAQALQAKKPYTDIKNLWVRKNNTIIKNEIRPLIENLDELPFPDKSSIDYQKVINKNFSINRFNFSRGCPYHCSYCSNRAISKIYSNGRKYYRARSPEKSIEEIERDQKLYKFKFIMFDDDCITMNVQWFNEFFKLYKEKFNYPFTCNIRVNTVNFEMLKIIKEAGGMGIGVGIEHGNEEFMKKYLNRDISHNKTKEVFEHFKQLRMSSWPHVIVGFPNENMNLFFDTVRLVRELRAKGLAYLFTPYPGTELYQLCEKNKWFLNNENYIDRLHPVASFPDFNKDEIKFCHSIYPLLIHLRFIPLKPILRIPKILIPFLSKIFSVIYFFVYHLIMLYRCIELIWARYKMSHRG